MATPASAQTEPSELTPLHVFSPFTAESRLIVGADNTFYGVTYSGGNFGLGTIYQITGNGSYTLVHSFAGMDGANPIGALAPGPDGAYYGTSSAGGANNHGTIYRVTPEGVLTTLHDFTAFNSSGRNVDGASPSAALVAAADGNFYGTAGGGGANGHGTFFKIGPDGQFTALHQFGGGDGLSSPGELAAGSDGNFFGLCVTGGANGNGAIFKLTPSGTTTTLHDFVSGQNPPGSAFGPDLVATPLALGNDGNLYGATNLENTQGGFVIFRVTPGGSFTVVHTFTGADAPWPINGLVQGSDGFFYGAAIVGQTFEKIAYRMDLSGTVTTVCTFTAGSGLFTGAPTPYVTFVEAPDGRFYVPGASGGEYGRGDIIRITKTGLFTEIFNFSDLVGSTPSSPLLHASDGNYYGTVSDRTTIGYGGFYRLTPQGDLTFLHQFPLVGSTEPDGGLPAGALLELTPGTFAGTTIVGGSNQLGAVYQITSDGTFTLLHAFSTAEGTRPQSGVVKGNDGSLYGTAPNGGTGDNGTIFKLATDGTLTVLHPFAGADGSHPQAGLLLGSDGAFYGTTNAGGTTPEGDSTPYGTIFKITPDGTLTTLHAFIKSDGANPAAELIQAADGNFYGVTTSGGLNNTGTVFQFSLAGSLNTLHSFGALDGKGINADGSQPQAALLQAADGKFYGTTFLGGASGGGVAYRITASGEFAVLHTFNAQSDGDINPAVPLIEDGQDSFFGATSATQVAHSGGGYGVIYRLDLVMPAITSALTATANLGQAFSYQITATGGATQFAATGLPAGLQINSATGAISGTPTDVGTYQVTIQATNINGAGTATLAITVDDVPAPVVTVGSNPPSRQNVAFAYQVVATNQPTSYSAAGLPAGLSIDAGTGRISGRPTVYGTFNVTLGASNHGGTGNAGLTLAVKQDFPVITSDLNPPSRQGVAFGYQIGATNSPTSYGAGGLPAGLQLNAATGRISGTPTGYGTFNVKIIASNSGGTTGAVLQLAVKQAAPVITSSRSASGKVGVAFSYTITASNKPTSYGESGLPAGLKINQSSGLISGTPTKAGTFNVIIAAFNGGGSSTATLSLVIK